MIKGVFKHFDVLNCLYHEILKHVNLIESVFFRTDLFGLKFHSDLGQTTMIAIQFDEADFGASQSPIGWNERI